jgi:hypothetical protein
VTVTQAGHPPVRWYEWGEEAFLKARSEDKPILLSIGAAWCHWCRVMDETSYRDPVVVEHLNRDYVPVRIDSDRRPDVNDRYNTEGWPTTAFLTPSGHLLGSMTFLPADQLRQVLLQLKTGYQANREKIAGEIARRDGKFAEALQQDYGRLKQLSVEIFRKTVRGIVAHFDPIHGGFGQAPKFPFPASLRVLLQALRETGGNDFEAVLVRTLDAMGDRGMYDAVEGGFFRYARNDTWSTPQFEKMGEDNAALIRLYLDASLVTGREKYRDRAVHALGWVRARLADRSRGVFFGSESGDEKYYLLAGSARESAGRPVLDTTVYTTVSAPMAATFLRAAEVLGDASLADQALRGLDFLLRECVTPEGVAHYYDGAPRLFTLARDRAALGSALLDAWEHTGDRRWLEAADTVTVPLVSRFWWAEQEGIADRAVGAAELGEVARPRKNMAENAQAAENLARLAFHLGNDDHRGWAERILLGFPDFLDDYGHYTAEYAMAADRLVRPPNEAGPDGLRDYQPRRVVRRGRAGA